MLKRSLILTISALCCFLNIFNYAYAEPEAEAEVQQEEVQQEEAAEDGGLAPSSQTALLMDMKSGEVLFEKNADEKRYPASTTKILTAILALEALNLSDVATATREAIEPITMEHSNMGILIGEELTNEQLLYGMLVHSSNDAANVLAIQVSGSLDAFAELMNQRAAELGATGTHFVNAHGFHDDNHYTTANDLAIFARYAMQNEKFREIVKTTSYQIPATNKYHETRYLSSTNHLISKVRSHEYYYSKATGIKTGHTDEAKNCLVASADDGQTELLSIVMMCEEESFTDTKQLFEYGFNNFKYTVIQASGDIVGDSCVVYEAKDNMLVSLTTDVNVEKLMPINYNKDDIIPERQLNEKIKAPIKKGDVLGTVTFKYNGQDIGSASLIAINDVKKDYIKASINLVVKVITHPVVLILAGLFIALRIMGAMRRNKKRQQRRKRLDHFKN